MWAVLCFIFTLYKTRSSAVAVIADHTAYMVRLANYQTSFSYKFYLIQPVGLEFMYAPKLYLLNRDH